MKVVIMGCGRIGARLATMLDNEGHAVSIIDLNPEAFGRLSPTFGGRTIVGTGIDEDVLKSAGIEEADAFVAVTTGDNRNIMASQIAKHVFGVPEVLCRIYDPEREDTYHLLGLDTVCPTTMISNVLREHIVTAAGRPVAPASRPAR
jgi:trk system potassium uptake protein TrkA